MIEGWEHRVLASAFRDFYVCLSDVGAEVEADPWHFTKRSGDGAEERAAARREAAARVRTRLRSFLRDQSRELARVLGPEGGERLDRAQYVMASLADEVFVNLQWEGRDVWGHELLETHLFGSHVAGERVFEQAEALLEEGGDEDWDLAYIYLSAISLGFLGKYRGAADDTPLQGLRRRLLAFVMRGRTTLADDLDPLFPQALEHTLVTSGGLRLPPVRTWAAVLAVVVAAYLVMAHLVWVDVSSGLREASQEMAESIVRAGEAAP